MAKVQYGPIVSDASGKTAGTIFSKWRTRSYIRRFVKPANPNTTLQQQIRDAFKLQTKRYLRMGSNLVAAWTQYAAGKPITNRSAFIGQTVEEERQATAWIFTPHDPRVFPVTDLVVTPGDTQLVLDWVNDQAPANGDTLVYCINQTDEELTIIEQVELVGAITATITDLVNGKTYVVGVCKKDTDLTPNGYGISVVDLGIPSV